MVQAGAHTLVDETPVQIGVLAKKASEKSGAFLMYEKGWKEWAEEDLIAQVGKIACQI